MEITGSASRVRYHERGSIYCAAMNDDPPSPVVRFERVSKKFGATPILREVSLQLMPGMLAGLVGVNGAGKTTLIKCLLDFCNLESGRIELFGLPHTQPHARRQLAFLPERFVPPHFLTARQFIKAMAGIAGQAYDEKRAISTFLEMDLAPGVLDKPVRALSKGMTQKLGLVACLLSKRRFYVLDEPMSGLDPTARVRVKHKLKQLKEDGNTLLMTSHSLADIEEICDHMLVLHDGMIAFAGAPADFRSQFGASNLEQAFLSCIESSHA